MRPRKFISTPRTASRIRADVDAELAFDIEMRTRDLIERGVDASVARQQAVAEFGDIDATRHYCTEVDMQIESRARRANYLEDLRADLRYTIRSFARSPGFFSIAMFTLALGIGATTAIFSVVNGVLLQPLPYPRSDRIVQLFQIDKNGKRMSVSQPNFRDWRDRTRGFSAMGVSSISYVVTANGLTEPIRAKVTDVSRDFFQVFGLAPEAGRLFANDETQTGGRPAVIVSDAFWRRYLDASPNALGRTLQIDSRSYAIIGVMPPDMNYPAGNDLWRSIELVQPNNGRSSHGYRVVARLKDGVSFAQAKENLSAVSRQMKQEYGDETWMFDGDMSTLHDQLVGSVKTTLYVLFGASAFLLLIACANVVNLLVARAAVRRAEVGVRVALGATTRRLAQQFLTETGALAIVGGAVGVGIAEIGVRVLLAMQTATLPRAGEVHLSGPVLAFALGISLATAAALGLLAVWHGARGDVRDALSASQRTMAGAGSAARIRRALVVAQMALTVVLLVGAGLLGHSFLRLLEVDPGFRTQHALVLDMPLPFDSDSGAAQRRLAFYDELTNRLHSIPGVGKVGLSTNFPLIGGGSDGEFLILSRPDEPVTFAEWSRLKDDPARSGYAEYTVVSADYFAAMNIPLLRGRLFNSGDAPNSAQVGIISAALAKEKWGNEDPIGKIIEYGNMDGDLRPFTIVGVVGDTRDESLASDPTPRFYALQQQRPKAGGEFHIVLQTAGDPTSVVASARAVAHQLRPDVPTTFRTVDSIISTSVADRRFLLTLVAVFGTVALVLATLGVYSVVSYLVAQRRQEIGVRIALGAQRGNVLALVLRQGAVLAIVGIAVGAGLALWLTRVLKGLVYGVSTTDPAAFVGVVSLLVLVALIASWIPARRAARVNPVEALRGA